MDEVKSFRRASSGTWKGRLAVAAAVAVLGGGAWLMREPSDAEEIAGEPKVVQAAPPPPRTEPPAPLPSPPPPAPAPADPPKPAEGDTKLADAFAAALAAPSAASPDAVSVTVRVTPQGAAIFDHGRRLGKDVVTVSIKPGTKKTLVALLDGHLPRKVVVDGSNTSVSISLRPGSAAAPASVAAGEAAPEKAPAAAAEPKAPAPAPPPAAAPASTASDPMLDVGQL